MLLWKLWRNLTYPYVGEEQAAYLFRMVYPKTSSLGLDMRQVVRAGFAFFVMLVLSGSCFGLFNGVRILYVQYVLTAYVIPFVLLAISPGMLSGLYNAWSIGGIFARSKNLLPMLAVTPLGWLGSGWFVAQSRYQQGNLRSLHWGLPVGYGVLMPVFCVVTVAVPDGLTSLALLTISFATLYVDGLMADFVGFWCGWLVGLWTRDMAMVRFMAMVLFLMVQVLFYVIVALFMTWLTSVIMSPLSYVLLVAVGVVVLRVSLITIMLRIITRKIGYRMADWRGRLYL